MGCDFYMHTYLTGYGSGLARMPHPPGVQARRPQAPESKKEIFINLAREPCYDAAYDSDSEDDRERQRQRRRPKPKVLMADGKWNISSLDKRAYYARIVQAEHPDITEITTLHKEYAMEGR